MIYEKRIYDLILVLQDDLIPLMKYFFFDPYLDSVYIESRVKFWWLRSLS